MPLLRCRVVAGECGVRRLATELRGRYADPVLNNSREPHMAKVLIIIGDATECLDTMYPYFRIAEDGYEVVVAAPEKRLYHMVLNEIPPGTDWDITQETAG